MANAIFENPGNSIEGRIERLQIMRSDGSIRESKQVNIHNTIVNGGLDNILTIGGFAAGSNTNNRTYNINYYNSNVSNYYPVLHYHLAQWIRMLWFMELGTDTNNTMTLYDMTDLVSPYINADQERYSQSHYIPTSKNLAIRGTTYDSMIEGDIHSTHRITSNSIKITEDNIEITEVGFFVGVNTSFTTSWPSQIFSVGDMFCRINLGEHKVTLNAGERLVVTYALTEYAGASTHQAIDDIHLVDSNGDPIKFKDDDGVEHTIGAIARTWMCDGKANLDDYSSYTVVKLPGDFTCIYPTEEWGYAIGRSRATFGVNNLYAQFTSPVWATFQPNYNSCSNGKFYDVRWNTSDFYSFTCNFRLSYSINLYTTSDYNTFDTYGFPSLNTKTSMRWGSIFVGNYEQNRADLLGTAGRCNDNSTNPTPYGNYTGQRIDVDYLLPSPTIKGYTRGNYYRDQEWVMPTYQPNVGIGNAYTTTLPDPRSTASIYWINIRGMLYKIGYFKESGNLSEFVPCPIKKKRGQVFRCTFREHVGRHIAGA